MSREYLELSHAFGQCLRYQIALGDRLVTAIGANLNALSAGEGVVQWSEVRALREKIRVGRGQLLALHGEMRRVQLGKSARAQVV